MGVQRVVIAEDEAIIRLDLKEILKSGECKAIAIPKAGAVT